MITIEKCPYCTVPEFLHSKTACGWNNASQLMMSPNDIFTMDSAEKQKRWEHFESFLNNSEFINHLLKALNLRDAVQICYFIELPANMPDAYKWLSKDGKEYTSDPEKAMIFTSRENAEKWKEKNLSTAIVTEHIFC